LLKEIEGAPPVLYCLGNAEILTRPQIAVVGSRRMTNYGARVGRELVGELAAAGLAITSGLAYGVDTVAHAAALDEEGETVAVLGCGVDLCYPQDHIRIYERIINSGKGAVISEIPPGIRTNRGIFVARNRIISGLSLGVLVIEGAKKSGTLITAGYAAKYGREVFAVPGPITSEYSDGPNNLIKEGAKAATCVEDILGEFSVESNSINLKGKDVKRPFIKDIYKDLGGKEKKVVEILVESGEEGVHIDTIIRKSGLESGEIGGILSKLEIKGIISSFGNGRYGLR
jgi:DNA processing protein